MCSSVGVHAATCRSGEATMRGGEAGLARDQDAADSTETLSIVGYLWGKCIGGITGIFGTTAFPDLSAIWQMIKDKVCSIASSQVRGVVSQVQGEINGVMSEANGAVTDAVNGTGVNDTGMGTVIRKRRHTSAVRQCRTLRALVRRTRHFGMTSGSNQVATEENPKAPGTHKTRSSTGADTEGRPYFRVHEIRRS